jgi:hypothetical protein
MGPCSVSEVSVLGRITTGGAHTSARHPRPYCGSSNVVLTISQHYVYGFLTKIRGAESLKKFQGAAELTSM